MRQKTITAIMAHAAAEYPRECCGVVAQKSRVERYFPCRNLAAEPTEHFTSRLRIMRPPRTGGR
jgi:proteasome lid subunit RPN8/RPN11